MAPLLSNDENTSWLIRVLYAGWQFQIPGLQWTMVVLYTLIPWVGVMAAGYGFGEVLQLPYEKRKRLCIAIGAASVILFIVLRATGIYGDPRPWPQPGQLPSLLGFLNTTKYPASLQFLLMTLGPVLIVLPFLENARGRISQWLAVFGHVPFFYYVLHIPLIHVVAMLISLVRTPNSTWWLIGNFPMMPSDVPPAYTWSLGLLYLVTMVVVIALYFPCRWFARQKAEARKPWMSFL